MDNIQKLENKILTKAFENRNIVNDLSILLISILFIILLFPFILLTYLLDKQNKDKEVRKK